jgi:hypothetical protein
MMISTHYYASNRQYTTAQLADIRSKLDLAIEGGVGPAGGLVDLLAERALLNLNTGQTDVAEPDLYRVLELTANDPSLRQELRGWALAELAAMNAAMDGDTGPRPMTQRLWG